MFWFPKRVLSNYQVVCRNKINTWLIRINPVPDDIATYSIHCKGAYTDWLVHTELGQVPDVHSIQSTFPEATQDFGTEATIN